MNDQLNIEISRNFFLKTKIMLGVFAAIIVLQCFALITATSNGILAFDLLKRAVLAPIFMLFLIATEFYMLRYIRAKLNTNTPVKNHLFYLVSFLEVSFPTTVIAIGAVFVGGTQITPYMIMNSPPELLYFIFLLAASLLLDSRLCFLLGLVIAIEYFILCSTLLYDATKIEFFITVVKSFIFFLSGILAAIVSRTIRKSVMAALNAQRILIEELDSKVNEKTAELNLQKEIVEEKQREILGSITYAQRLQQAILATREEISQYLPKNFLLYKPKDIVAGDFYFFETTTTHIFIAAADCTGHGVPGAMVSIVCSNALTRSVKEFGLTDPGKILDRTGELVVQTFEKSGQDVRDGMDISFLAFNRETRELFWAGANNPLWYLLQGRMIEIKGDKQPIGKTENPTPFTTHSVPGIGTTIYLLTDGYADQFGGPKGKKFKYKQLKELLEKNAQLKLVEQRRILEQTFEAWRGDLEQVDDVCIVGFQV